MTSPVPGSMNGANVLISICPSTPAAGDFAAFGIFKHVGFLNGPLPSAELVHLERHQGLRHAEIVQRVIALRSWLATPFGNNVATCHLACDSSGAGRPIYDMLRAEIGSVVHGVKISGADQNPGQMSSDGIHSVSKLQSYMALDSAIQAGRLKIAEQMPLASTLMAEAAALSAQISSAGRVIIAAPDPSHSRFQDMIEASAVGWALAETLWQKHRIAYWRGLWPDRLNAPAFNEGTNP